MNAGSTYRVGVKRIMDIYPRSLKDRILKERQEKIWDPAQRACVADTAAKLAEQEATAKADKDSSPPTGIEKLAKDNLENEMECLNNLDKKFKDTTYQVIIFQHTKV